MLDGHSEARHVASNGYGSYGGSSWSGSGGSWASNSWSSKSEASGSTSGGWSGGSWSSSSGGGSWSGSSGRSGATSSTAGGKAKGKGDTPFVPYSEKRWIKSDGTEVDLHKEIMERRSAHELLEIVGEFVCEFAVFHASAALHRIAKCEDAIMLEYTFQNLLWVMLAVLTAVLLVSASPSFVAVMAFCVLSCCTHMFGWMALTGTPLNALSLIPLLLAVGLCVDYCAHVVHAFWGEQGTSPKRTACALRLRGVAVAHGGLSTALSQVLLAFSESLIFTIFFKMMCGVVVVGQLSRTLLGQAPRLRTPLAVTQKGALPPLIAALRGVGSRLAG